MKIMLNLVFPAFSRLTLEFEISVDPRIHIACLINYYNVALCLFRTFSLSNKQSVCLFETLE